MRGCPYDQTCAHSERPLSGVASFKSSGLRIKASMHYQHCRVARSQATSAPFVIDTELGPLNCTVRAQPSLVVMLSLLGSGIMDRQFVRAQSRKCY
jgi:hypothetical protein